MRKYLLIFLLWGGWLNYVYSQIPPDSIVSETEFTDSLDIPFETMIDSIFGKLDDSLFPQKIVLERGVPLIELSDFDGVNDSIAGSPDIFRRAFGTLYYGQTDFEARILPHPDQYEDYLDNCISTDPCPIGIIAFSYHKLKPWAEDSGLVHWTDGQLIQDSGKASPFLLDTTFVCASFAASDTNLSTQFIVPNQLLITNLDNITPKLKIDFGDGEGYRPLVLDSTYSIHYSDKGLKQIRVRYEEVFTKVLEGTTNYKVSESYLIDGSDPDIVWFTEADEAFKGEKATGKVSVFLACGHDKIEKPWIVAEGFYPTEVLISVEEKETISPVSFFRKFQNFLFLREQLNLAGYDIIYLDYSNGTDYIERNALLLKKVIHEVNQKKVQNGSTEKNVVMGLSMGGLVARYAMIDMEANGPSHDARLLFCFDSPNQGAYTSLGLQYFIHHLNKITMYGIPIRVFAKDIKKLEAIQERPSSRQMQYIRHDRLSTFSRTAPDYTDRKNLWKVFHDSPNRGFPTQCRNVAISNGSQQAVGQSFNANDRILEIKGWNNLFVPDGFGTFILFYRFGTSVRLNFSVFGLPNQSQGKRSIYRGKMFAFIGLSPVVISNWNISVNANQSFDAAPGGQLDLADALSTVPIGVDLKHPLVNFIPTNSALDVLPPDSANLWYHVQNGSIVSNSKTVLDAYDAPDGLNVSAPENEIHVAVTRYNDEFFEQEFLYPLGNRPPATLSNETYHYADGVYTRLQPITVNSGGRLVFNRNEGIGFGVNALAPPPVGQAFVIKSVTDDCVTASEVVIENGGRMELGEATTNNKATVHFTPTSRLVLKTGSQLVINQGSKLIIEGGAELVVYPDASIMLDGNLATLEIDGRLTLDSAAVFSFSGAGSILYGNPYGTSAINCGPNSKILLQGQSRTHKILHLKDFAKFEPGGSHVDFQLKNGLVVMESGSRIAMTGPAYTLKDLDVLALNAQEIHKGIRVFGQPSHCIEEVTIAGGETGIRGELFFGGARLNLKQVEIRDCGLGMNISGKGVFLDQVTFRNNEIGYYQSGANLPSVALNCTFDQQNLRAIDFEGAGAGLHLAGCTVDNNAAGVRIRSGGELTARCGSIADNTAYGIFGGPGSSIILNDFLQSTGAQVDLAGNGKTIELDRATWLDLRYGNNDLAAKVSGSGSIITGDLENTCGAFSSLDASENHWRGSGVGTSPVWSTDYTLNLTGQYNNLINCSNAVTVSDPSPVTGNPGCVLGPGGYGGGSGFNRLANCGTCPQVTTPTLGSLRLDSAVNAATQKMTLVDDSLGNDREAITLFAEILTDSTLGSTTDGFYYQQLAYRRMRAAFNQAMADSLISSWEADHEAGLDTSATRLIATARKLGNFSGEPRVQFWFKTEEALYLRALGLRGASIDLLDSLSRNNCPDHYLAYLEGLICRTKVERDVLNGNLNLMQADSALALCEPGEESEKRALFSQRLQSSGGTAVSEDNKTRHSLKVRAYPNPSPGVFRLVVVQGELSEATVVVRNMQGRVVKREQWSADSGHRKGNQIDLRNAGKGIYLVEVSNGLGGVDFIRVVIK